MAMLPDEGVREPLQDYAGLVVHMPTVSSNRRPEFLVQPEGRSVPGLGRREARPLEVVDAGRNLDADLLPEGEPPPWTVEILHRTGKFVQPGGGCEHGG